MTLPHNHCHQTETLYSSGNQFTHNSYQTPPGFLSVFQMYSFQCWPLLSPLAASTYLSSTYFMFRQALRQEKRLLKLLFFKKILLFEYSLFSADWNIEIQYVPTSWPYIGKWGFWKLRSGWRKKGYRAGCSQGLDLIPSHFSSLFLIFHEASYFILPYTPCHVISLPQAHINETDKAWTKTSEPWVKINISSSWFCWGICHSNRKTSS